MSPKRKVVDIPSLPPSLSALLLKVMLPGQGLWARSPSLLTAPGSGAHGQPGSPREPSQGTCDIHPPDHKWLPAKKEREGGEEATETITLVSTFSLIECDNIYWLTSISEVLFLELGLQHEVKSLRAFPSSVSSQSGPSEEYHGNKRHFDILAIQIKALSVSILASMLTHQLCDYRPVTRSPGSPLHAQGPGWVSRKRWPGSAFFHLLNCFNIVPPDVLSSPWCPELTLVSWAWIFHRPVIVGQQPRGRDRDPPMASALSQQVLPLTGLAGSQSGACTASDPAATWS